MRSRRPSQNKVIKRVIREFEAYNRKKKNFLPFMLTLEELKLLQKNILGKLSRGYV